MSRSPRPSRLSASLTLVTLFALTSCAHQVPTAATEPVAPPVSACSAFARLSFDRLKDTDETIREIRAYDAGRDALCGAGK